MQMLDFPLPHLKDQQESVIRKFLHRRRVKTSKNVPPTLPSSRQPPIKSPEWIGILSVSEVLFIMLPTGMHCSGDAFGREDAVSEEELMHLIGKRSVLRCTDDHFWGRELHPANFIWLLSKMHPGAHYSCYVQSIQIYPQLIII